MIAVALTTLEDETCKGCGVPYWHSRSSHQNIKLDIKSTTCYGCKEVEDERAKNEKSKRASAHGVKQWVQAVPYDEVMGLPSRTESYERENQIAARRAARQAGQQ